MKKFEQDFPDYRNFFSFPAFNPVQTACYNQVTTDHRNIIVSAPTSTGKTVIFQLAIIRHSRYNLKCLYLAPIKSLCHEKSSSWGKKFGKLKMIELTGDTSSEGQQEDLSNVELVIATPEKIDSFSKKNLDFLKSINLLLIDEVHMLNFEERGATLEAIVSRIMSLSNPRIIAVSATIPNIEEVARWLKIPKELTFTFGNEYRPVQISKVVLGFKATANPYTFERMLNFKLLEVVRSYSYGKGALVFCQTQKGTEMACQQLISGMRERQFIGGDEDLLALIQGSKRVTNSGLQLLLPQGVAFHNAGLSFQDRGVVEKLFLENRIRVLCTTSTLALGINLPARLVVIKSTQCYRGAGKGYQEYTQIEIEQMMGRAGRPPFDTEGTVVIMTEQSNYKKYLNAGKLETLESHLYTQLSEHLNTQITIKSLRCLPDVLHYFKNSFCYIRMCSSPAYYGLGNKATSLRDIEREVLKICEQSIEKLSKHSFITYYPENEKIVPRQLGINVSRNNIYIDTMIGILTKMPMKGRRQYFETLCNCSLQLKKYRNKLDERKLLKQINENNLYTLKSSVATPEKKCFVLIQSELDGRHIDNWQMRKQAKDMIFLMARLSFCVKAAANDRKMFWPFYWSALFHKYFSLKFWDRNEQMGIRQFSELNNKWKSLSTKGFKNISHVCSNLPMLDSICQTKGELRQVIAQKIESLEDCLRISVHKQQQKLSVKIKFMGKFWAEFKHIMVCIGEKASNELYEVRNLNQENRETTIFLNNAKKEYYLGIIKTGYIGFDEFYLINYNSSNNLIKIEKPQNQHQEKRTSDQARNRNSADHAKTENTTKPLTSIRSNSLDGLQGNNKIMNKIKRCRDDWSDDQKEGAKIKKERSSFKMLPPKKPGNAAHEGSRKINHDFEISQEEQTMRRGTYIPLNEYKCWKPGFPTFEDSMNGRETINHKKLKLIDESGSGKGSAKSFSSFSSQNKNKMLAANTRQSLCTISKRLKKYNYNEEFQMKAQERRECKKENQSEIKDVYDYFYNLF